ncbi:hypothetical protein BDF14DRAFT_1886156 [Spinellus fusiger]|nr:hypothetical protein BDF14DRAFT_1886156 [Spinellus fusiger]
MMHVVMNTGKQGPESPVCKPNGHHSWRPPHHYQVIKSQQNNIKEDEDNIPLSRCYLIEDTMLPHYAAYPGRRSSSSYRTPLSSHQRHNLHLSNAYVSSLPPPKSSSKSQPSTRQPSASSHEYEVSLLGSGFSGQRLGHSTYQVGRTERHPMYPINKQNLWSDTSLLLEDMSDEDDEDHVPIGVLQGQPLADRKNEYQSVAEKYKEKVRGRLVEEGVNEGRQNLRQAMLHSPSGTDTSLTLPCSRPTVLRRRSHEPFRQYYLAPSSSSSSSSSSQSPLPPRRQQEKGYKVNQEQQDPKIRHEQHDQQEQPVHHEQNNQQEQQTQQEQQEQQTSLSLSQPPQPSSSSQSQPQSQPQPQQQTNTLIQPTSPGRTNQLCQQLYPNDDDDDMPLSQSFSGLFEVQTHIAPILMDRELADDAQCALNYLMLRSVIGLKNE